MKKIFLILAVLYVFTANSQQMYKIVNNKDIVNNYNLNQASDSDLKEFKIGVMFNILGQAPSVVSLSLDFFPVKYVSVEGGLGLTGIFSFYEGAKLHLPLNKTLDLYSGVFATNIELPGLFNQYTPLKTLYFPLGIEYISEKGFSFGGELGLIDITEDEFDNVDGKYYPWIGLKIGYHYSIKY